MRGGDLDNTLAPAVGMRFERVIKTEEGKLNQSAKAFIEAVMRQDVNFYIITTEDKRKAMTFLAKWGIPYTDVFEAESPLEIPLIVRSQDMITYYDLDRDILQNVNSQGHGKVEVKQWTSVLVS